MKLALLVFLLQFGGSLIAEEAQNLFFDNHPAAEVRRIALSIVGNKVTGTQSWQPSGAEHGSRGTLSGTISKGGIIQVIHEYNIEGSDQSEEEILKLARETLSIGQGELVENKERRMLTLKNPAKVSFESTLKKISTHEPTAGTPERKAIMAAMRTPASKEIGEAVKFVGVIRVCGDWARFQGNVETSSGKAPADETAASKLELDFFALLNSDGKSWRVMHSGFAGDISVGEEAREKFPKASWVLFE